MNKYLKQFLLRGLIFGGFGPIVAGFVYFFISLSLNDFSLSGFEVLLVIISTYILAFVHAGASVFNQIEHWSTAKSLLFHMGALYIAYVLCYMVNSWIPFEPLVILIFTGIFIASYLIIWAIVYFCIKSTTKKFNKKIK